MTFEPTDEVLQIKRQLQEKEGIQVDQIRLIYSGKQLADDKPLEFYNIQAGGTIHMVLQLRGGGAPCWAPCWLASSRRLLVHVDQRHGWHSIRFI